MKRTPEGLLLASVRRLLSTLGIYHWRVQQGFGCAPGISDILGVEPKTGRIIAIETKAPHGKLSDHQDRFLKMIQENGGIAIVAYDLDDVINGLGMQDRFLFR